MYTEHYNYFHIYHKKLSLSFDIIQLHRIYNFQIILVFNDDMNLLTINLDIKYSMINQIKKIVFKISKYLVISTLVHMLSLSNVVLYEKYLHDQI